jgi:heme/copper-type cytochrome/quinol oxidase subunit 2
MSAILICLGAYLLVCGGMLLFFMVGHAPALEKKNWNWPVIFFWPLLIFWPVFALAGFFIRRKLRAGKN